MDGDGTDTGDFLLGCAALSAVSRGDDRPIGGDTPEEQRRWRLAMGLLILAVLVAYAALEWILGWFFGV